MHLYGRKINTRLYLSSACLTVLAIPNRELIAAAAPPPFSSIRAPTNDKIIKVDITFTRPLNKGFQYEVSAPNKYEGCTKSDQASYFKLIYHMILMLTRYPSFLT